MKYLYLLITLMASLTLGRAANLLTHANTLADGALSLFPALDAGADSFQKGEFTLGSGPAWMSRHGGEPFLATDLDYFPHRNLGVGAGALMFGDGRHTRTFDQNDFHFTLRLPRGNVALEGVLGVGYDYNRQDWFGEAGPKLAYRSTTTKLKTETSAFIVRQFTGCSSADAWLGGVQFGVTF